MPPQMSKNATETASKNFELTCTDCTFETTIEGTFLDALDAADSHEAAHERGHLTHFVDIARNVA